MAETTKIWFCPLCGKSEEAGRWQQEPPYCKLCQVPMNAGKDLRAEETSNG